VSHLTHIPMRERLRLGRMRHRSPRYVYARTRQFLYERSHPGEPWITPEAIRMLDSMLLPSDHGLEFGSGRSTIWFAKRVCSLTSVEHSADWYAMISGQLKEQDLGNVKYILAARNEPEERGDTSEYARTAMAFATSSLDFVLIDGAYRGHTAKYALPRIKPGGVLIIDNVNWYLPSASRSPNSRTLALGPKEQIWAEVANSLAGWRRIWTSSGVTDTAIYVKPGIPEPGNSRAR
jgi:predicted O-methyltransferase YrrM